MGTPDSSPTKDNKMPFLWPLVVAGDKGFPTGSFYDNFFKIQSFLKNFSLPLIIAKQLSAQYLLPAHSHL